MVFVNVYVAITVMVSHFTDVLSQLDGGLSITLCLWCISQINDSFPTALRLSYVI